jgi:phospholipase/carboxylesterase
MPIDLERTLHLLPREGAPSLLFIHLHGVGASALAMTPVAERLARAYPQAAQLIPDAFDAFDQAPEGRQWFSVHGVDEANRPGRVAAVMPRLVALVQEAQRQFGLAPATTALVGFSQGAILALEAAKLEPPLCGRVIAFGGRFATLPSIAPTPVVHILHGKEDAVVAFRHAVEAATIMVGQGGDVTADIVPGIGHEPHPDLLERAVEHLQSYLPRRVWAEALAEAPIWPGKAGSRDIPH